MLPNRHLIIFREQLLGCPIHKSKLTLPPHRLCSDAHPRSSAQRDDACGGGWKRRSRPQAAPSLSSLSSADPSQSTSSARQPAPAACRMVAIFDYDPRESSPNTDIEVKPPAQSDVLKLQQQQAVLILCLTATGGADLQRWGHHSCVW